MSRHELHQPDPSAPSEQLPVVASQSKTALEANRPDSTLRPDQRPGRIYSGRFGTRKDLSGWLTTLLFSNGHWPA